MKRLLICVAMMLLLTNPLFAESGHGNAKENEPSVESNEQPEESAFSHFKNGMNSSLLSLLYTPIKVNIAVIGGVVGGVAYPLSGFNAGISKKIWTASMGGTYLITEDILAGEEEAELFLKKKKSKE